MNPADYVKDSATEAPPKVLVLLASLRDRILAARAEAQLLAGKTECTGACEMAVYIGSDDDGSNLIVEAMPRCVLYRVCVQSGYGDTLGKILACNPPPNAFWIVITTPDVNGAVLSPGAPNVSGLNSKGGSA